jgi:hypothetical protein
MEGLWQCVTACSGYLKGPTRGKGKSKTQLRTKRIYGLCPEWLLFLPWLAIEHIQVLCRPGELAEGSELRCCQ